MAINVELQNDEAFDALPQLDNFRVWVETALQKPYRDFEQTIRIVGEQESELLNRQFRGQQTPTNVLSFASESQLLGYDYLGDLVICAPVVEAEALAQAKPAEAHWAHMVVHGMLHLQGFEHHNDSAAAEMEALEISILTTLGYANPYNGRHD